MSPDPPEEPGSITLLLRAHKDGERGAFDRVVSRVYDELTKIARQQLRRRRPGQTLDTAALVHDAYARLLEQGAVDWQDRTHFYAVVARAMRFLVVDRARRKTAQKRGGGEMPATIDVELIGKSEPIEVVLAVDQAVERLASFNQRLATLVELRFFAGMTDDEIAAALETSSRTVSRDWLRARAWLQRALGEQAPSGG